MSDGPAQRVNGSTDLGGNVAREVELAQSRDTELETLPSITQRRESVAALLGQLVRAVEDNDLVDDRETPIRFGSLRSVMKSQRYGT